jgi:hypothetical protein
MTLPSDHTRALRLRKFSAEVRACKNRVLQYNRDRDDLVTWDWYVCVRSSADVLNSQLHLKANNNAGSH